MKAAEPIRVSAIVPCYNAAAFIGKCLDSLLLQGDSLAEIICVDDCSSDNTYALLLDFQRRYPGMIRVLKNDVNSGAAFSRNAGLAEARGDYIQFLDADDELLEGKTARQLQLIGKEKEMPGFIAGAFTREFPGGRKEICIPESADPWIALLDAKLGCTCSNLWKRTVLQDVKGLDPALRSSQEFDLMLRLLKNKVTVLGDKEPLTLVRVRASGSISTTDRTGNWKRFAGLRAGAVKWMEENKLLTDPHRRQKAYQALFDAIRLWYAVAPAEAWALYAENIPAGFRPGISATSSPVYIRMFRLFGFRGAERIKKILGR